MRPLIVVATFLLVTVAAASQHTVRDLDTLVLRHTDARGGAAAIESVESIRIGFEVTEPEFTVDGEYVATRSGYVRVDIYAGGERVFTEVLTPGGGWQAGPDGSEARPLSDDGRAALERGRVRNLYGLHELESLGYALEWLGVQRIGDVDYWAVDVTAPDGFAERLFFDTATSLLGRRSETSALHPDVDATPVERVTLRGDFRRVGGIVFSHASKTLDITSGEQLQADRVTDIEINPDIDTNVFTQP